MMLNLQQIQKKRMIMMNGVQMAIWIKKYQGKFMSVSTQKVDEVVIRFAGDSGDGMQLTGGRFTETTAIVGNDLSTLPDFPAEIRAPAGSLAGVSAFQIKFSSKDIHTPGDKPDVLVAMNPAALKVHQKEIMPGV